MGLFFKILEFYKFVMKKDIHLKKSMIQKH